MTISKQSSCHPPIFSYTLDSADYLIFSMNEVPPKPQPGWRMRFMKGTAQSQNTRAEQEEAQFIAFITQTVRPAFSEIAQRLASKGRQLTLQETRAACGITVSNGSLEEIGFRISSQTLPTAIAPQVEIKMHERKGLRIVRKTAPLRRNGLPILSLQEASIEDIITEFMHYYADALARIEAAQ